MAATWPLKFFELIATARLSLCGKMTVLLALTQWGGRFFKKKLKPPNAEERSNALQSRNAGPMLRGIGAISSRQQGTEGPSPLLATEAGPWASALLPGHNVLITGDIV